MDAMDIAGGRTAIRGGIAMKRWKYLLLSLLLGLPGSGCTPDFGEDGNAPVLMRIVEISTVEGVNDEESAFLNSDVTPIFNDNVTVTVEVIPKNPRLPNNITSPLQDVLVERYEVRYLRSDGLSEEGVDVPFTISGGLGVLARVGDETEVVFVLVRHQAKFEPPLSNLRGSVGGENVLSVTAEITLHGRTTAGDVVSTRGFVRINFADFVDTP
jgi:hypothetical protein